MCLLGRICALVVWVVLLAGCVPFVSFLVERRVTHKVKAGQKL